MHLSVDNDSLAGSDGEYSSGVQLGWASGYMDSYGDAAMIPDRLGRWLDRLALLRGEDRQHLLSLSASHRIFTPSDTSLVEPSDGRDMPYSASFYVTTTAAAQDAEHMDALSLTLGVVGPLAFGEEVQNAVHDWIDSNEANGWEEQIPNEPLLNLSIERRWALARGTDGGRGGGWGGDWLGSLNGSVGNLLTAAGAGTSLRWGWNVPDDFSMPPPFLGDEVAGARPVTRLGAESLSAYAFVHVDGSGIAHAVQWDGATLRDGPSVDYEPVIARIFGGFAFHRGSWSLSLSFAAMNVPWDHPLDEDLQWYGRLGVSWSD